MHHYWLITRIESIRTQLTKHLWWKNTHHNQAKRRPAHITISLRASISSQPRSVVSTQIDLWGQIIPVSHISSARRRKTLSLRMRSSGIVVTTPHRCNTTMIERFVRSKQQWILDQRLTMRPWPMHELQDGKVLYLEWQAMTLRVMPHTSPRTRITMDDATLLVTWSVVAWSDRDDSVLRNTLTRRYKQQAQQNLIPLTRELIQQYEFDPTLHIAIKSYKSAYGKCRWGNEIFLNYRIVMFPPEIIRHIILHELAHTRHMNHSKQFRDCLKQIDPQTDKHRLRLRQHGSWYLE